VTRVLREVLAKARNYATAYGRQLEHGATDVEAEAQAEVANARGDLLLAIRAYADGEAECKACQARRRAGLAGLCPACANDRARGVL
jgi:hypothetical protein